MSYREVAPVVVPDVIPWGPVSFLPPIAGTPNSDGTFGDPNLVEQLASLEPGRTLLLRSAFTSIAGAGAEASIKQNPSMKEGPVRSRHGVVFGRIAVASSEDTPHTSVK